ncbi:hypothetical protein GCM10020216_109070 [Nonomuraea helvata]
MTEIGKIKQIRRGPDVLRLPLQIGQRHPLHKDRGSGNLQQGRLPADAGSDRHGRVHELTQDAIAAQGQGCGDGTMGGKTRSARHVGTLHCGFHLGADLDSAMAKQSHRERRHVARRFGLRSGQRASKIRVR